MTIGTTLPEIDYVENGVTLVHAIPFQFRDAADIVCSRIQGGAETILVKDVDFTVSGGAGGTGSVTKANGGVATAIFRIRRKTTRAQSADYTAHDAFPAETHEIALDRQAMVNQEQDVAIDGISTRTLRVPVGEAIDEAPVAGNRKGKIFGWSAISGLIEYLSYQSLANIIAPLLNVAFQGVPGPGNDLATHIDSYLDLSGDDTVAFATALLAAQAGTGVLKLGKRDLHISQVTIPAGVKVVGAGKGVTRIFQIAGQPVGTPIVKIGGSRSGIRGVTLIGNIATDASEFQHGISCVVTIATGSLTDIEILDVEGQDLRGDVVVVGVVPAAYAAGFRLSVVRIGAITGDNIHRNGLSITGGRDIQVQSVECTRNGLYGLDIETDAGAGPISGVRVGYVKASFIGIIGTTAADFLEGIDIGHIDLDRAHATTSAPAYPIDRSANVQGADAILVRNCKNFRLRSYRINNYDGQAIQQIYNGGELATQRWRLGVGELTNICLAETVYHAFLAGAPGVTRLVADQITATATLTDHRVLDSFSVGTIGQILANGPVGAWRALSNCDDVEVGVLTQTNGFMMVACNRCKAAGGSFNGDTVFSFANDCQTVEMALTASTAINVGGARSKAIGGSIGGVANLLTIYNGGSTFLGIDGSGNVSGAGNITTTGVMSAFNGYDVGGQFVVRSRKAAVADAAGGATVDAEARAAINALLSRLRATGGHGLIAD